MALITAWRKLSQETEPKPPCLLPAANGATNTTVTALRTPADCTARSGTAVQVEAAIHAFMHIYPALVSAKADPALQDRALRKLHRIALQVEKGKHGLSVARRYEIANKLAAIAMAQTERSAKFRQMFCRFVDDEVRQHANTQAWKNKRRFKLADAVYDLRHLRSGRGVASNGPDSTRPAQFLEIDGKTHYVKEIAYGPRAAATEAAAATILALTGQGVPLTRLARYEDIPRAVASQLIPGYQDLGALLLDRNRIAPLIEKEWGKGGMAKLDAALDRAAQAGRRLAELDAQAGGGEALARRQARTERYAARREIYNLLPPDMLREVAKGQFRSRLVGDDDFVNFEWCNAGFTREGSFVALDFGNSLYQGFKGFQRDSDNLQYANQRARPDDPYPPNQVRSNDHTFSEKAGESRTNVGGIPRSRPVAALLEESVGAETRLAEFGGTITNMKSLPRHEMPFLLGQLEAAFGLTLIPDQALRIVVARTWPEPDDPGVPYQEHEKQNRPTADKLADLLIARRDALIKEFTPQELMLWKQKYPERADACHKEIAAAVANLTGIYIPACSTAVQADRRMTELA